MLAEEKSKERCGPAQWEGRTYSWYPMAHLQAVTNISYDYKNQQAAFSVASWKGSKDTGDFESKHYKVVIRFDDQKLFYVDRESNNCTVRTITHEMRKSCVPEEAKQMRSLTIGARLDADLFLWKKSWKEHTAKFAMTITDKNVPIMLKFESERFSGIHEYYDLSKGIEDDHVFDTPAEDSCVDISKDHIKRGLTEEHDFQPHLLMMF